MPYGRITPKQQEILDYIKNEILNRGFPPAVREICEAVNLKSTSSVHSHLEALEKNGYIVVALIDDGATVKTFHKEKGYYRLQPENDTMEPILVHEGLQILGKVFGVFRLYE